MPAGGKDDLSLHRQLVFDEIRSIVAEAIKAGGTLRVGPHAKRLAETYSGSGFSQGRIADELILAAAQANVPVEMDRGE